MWLEDYEKLNNPEKEQFARQINALLAETFLVRDRYDKAVDSIRASLSYRFVDRYFELFTSYLAMAGWHLNKDRHYGVIYIDNDYGQNRRQLNLFQTLVLYCLRLLYDEEREKLNLRNEIQTTPYEVAMKLINLESRRRKPADRDLSDALKIFARHQILQKIDGAWEDERAKLLILPSILFVLPNKRIVDVYRAIVPEDGGDIEASPAIEVAAGNFEPEELTVPLAEESETDDSGILSSGRDET